MPPAPAKRWWKAARWTRAQRKRKPWIGVQHPHRAEVLTELKRSTAARVCTGRAGPRPRTQALLRFTADHSRSKDTVLKEVPEAWVKAQGLLEVRSEISDKNLYLTRPDMGRRLSPEAIDALKAQCVMDPDVQVVVSDGLSTDAITANYEEILAAAACRPETGGSEGRDAVLRALWPRQD